MPSSHEHAQFERAGSAARRVAMNAIALALLYGNAAIALQPPALGGDIPHLPRPFFVIDAFMITGMFGSYSDSNTDLYIEGERTREGAPSDRGAWIELPVREHFVHRQGVSFTQLFSAHEWDMHGPDAQLRSWAFLARRIREHNNRLHPTRPVGRVAFGCVAWPQSPLGYRALKRPSTSSRHLWFEESESR